MVVPTMEDDARLLKMTAQQIKQDLKNLSGLSQDVANTIANIYYGFNNHTYNFLKLAGRSDDPRQLQEDTAFYMSSINFMKSEVELIRKTKKTADAKTYCEIEALFLDSYKYRLKASMGRTRIGRKIERSLAHPREIKNLLFFVCEFDDSIYP